jgi:cellulose synthase/poly-beta-1,6-N-acetylglucosamine synthase-like glycosyltransferase
MNTPWHIAVVIPARDEEVLLPRCLRSIQEARSLLPPHVTSDLVVVSDQSIDDTFEIAKKIVRHTGTVVEIDAGCVGIARAMGARIALDRYQGPMGTCWLANTDADCEVPITWLLNQLDYANAGIAAVAGIVDVDSFAEHESCVAERFRLSYCISEDNTHPHVHGANLGVRADAYLEAGGWRDLSTAEDHDLWRRLQVGLHRQISDAALCVLTSGRRVGRAPLGFAGALAAHNGVTT